MILLMGGNLLPCAHWGRGIDMQFAALGMASPFLSSGIRAHASHSFTAKMAMGRLRTRDGLHVSLKTDPSGGRGGGGGGHLCTHHH